MEPITEDEIRIRQVTHYQVTWTELDAGQPGTFTVQLILDEGADEHIIRPTADDMNVLFELLDRGQSIYFDMNRKVLMFGNRQA